MASKTVLVAPLHWGLGHAARCIPIIEQQLAEGNRVLIAASEGPRALLNTRFNSRCTFIEIPFMRITYPKDGNMARHFFFKGPSLLWNIWREHLYLRSLVQKENIDAVISDSRFGLWNKRVQSIFISHQIEIKAPLFQGLINRLNRWVMNRYDEVWIPDYADKPGLAGDLSHSQKMPLRYKYIGPLSRFNKKITQGTSAGKVVVIVSGPEPQRTLFENQIIARFKASSEKVIILSGKPHIENKEEADNITIVNHLNDDDLIKELESASMVIARSGYSTIMDFHVLGVNAEYIATPGQTEQEYLMQLHS
ncbi:MAG TPA: glycosyltransferase [Flavobacteriales bacterium]|nr:glycosyltransferase [Flavobacteriales bacterium]